MMRGAVMACVVMLALAGNHRVDGQSQVPDVYSCTASQMPGVVCYDSECTKAISAQIKVELNAAFSYMYIAALFDDNTRARPGLAKFLYESASEEREHAILMLEYLNKRGVSYIESFDFKALLDSTVSKIPTDLTYDAALRLALEMEIMVTDKIYKIIVSCVKDYHGADFFTNPILEEQHDGIRKLQGAIKDLENIKAGPSTNAASGPLAEFLFDKKILENGL